MLVAEPIEFGGKTITPQNLYMGLFIIGIPLLWFAAPISTFFWLLGSSGFVIGAHAGLMEPGVESYVYPAFVLHEKGTRADCICREYQGLETV